MMSSTLRGVLAAFLSVAPNLVCAGANAVEPARACHEAAQAAERRFALPRGLLDAISEVETGRWRASASRVEAWPWTVQAEGNGLYFPTEAAAIAWVEQARAQGIASIDVGCMQVNLMYHPRAFADLRAAFDPVQNADYAARFLLELHGRTVTWPTAIGFYHSQTVALANIYRRRVEGSLASIQVEKLPPTTLQMLSLAWSATLTDAGGTGTDPGIRSDVPNYTD